MQKKKRKNDSGKFFNETSLSLEEFQLKDVKRRKLALKKIFSRLKKIISLCIANYEKKNGN